MDLADGALPTAGMYIEHIVAHAAPLREFDAPRESGETGRWDPDVERHPHITAELLLGDDHLALLPGHDG